MSAKQNRDAEFVGEATPANFCHDVPVMVLEQRKRIKTKALR
ncbi:MAG: hypothetical protein NT002_10275 [candidate division Zixibacteria bacterium]|nr:hypothetical protein [candidate division Zixibacteria bacterium]